MSRKVRYVVMAAVVVIGCGVAVAVVRSNSTSDSHCVHGAMRADLEIAMSPTLTGMEQADFVAGFDPDHSIGSFRFNALGTGGRDADDRIYFYSDDPPTRSQRHELRRILEAEPQIATLRFNVKPINAFVPGC